MVRKKTENWTVYNSIDREGQTVCKCGHRMSLNDPRVRPKDWERLPVGTSFTTLCPTCNEPLITFQVGEDDIPEWHGTS